MFQRLVRGIVLGVFLCGLLPTPQVMAEDELVQSAPSLLITEVKLTNQNVSEFITVYNPSDQVVDLGLYDVSIEYAKPGLAPSICALNDWTSGGSITSRRKLTGEIEAHAVLSFTYSLTDKIGGSLRLVARQPSFTVLSEVHWGSTTSASPCSTNYVPIPLEGASLQRFIDCETGLPVVTGVSSNDFALSMSPGYGVYAGVLTSNCDESNIPSDPVESQLSCEGLIISELLPNPSGADAGREYIELYNPTNEVIELQGCMLQLSGGKQHVFSSGSLEPWSFQAFSDAQTGLTLPNSAGATVWLVSVRQVEVSYVTYPAGLEDDVAWALIDGTWQVTYVPTPGAVNVAQSVKPCPDGQERNPETSRCVTAVVAGAELTPCKEGQERNPETNRCRAIAAAAALAPCKAGQERNPETNRCRAIASSANALKPCAADQERNPETNRCRKVASASALAPCKSGQERNPETNRCRKIAAKSGQIASVQDVESDKAASKTSWLITGTILLAAVTYAIYEWRQDIRVYLKRTPFARR